MGRAMARVAVDNDMRQNDQYRKSPKAKWAEYNEGCSKNEKPVKPRSKITTLALKAMGIFGGVQMVGIVCSLIRTKLVALWIGTAGVGLFGIFNQALEMLNMATNLGIRQSSVRDLSQASADADRRRLSRLIAVVRRWSLWLALGGALLTMALAPLLSRFTFGDYDHLWHYVALSTAVLLMALTNGEYAVFQGVAKLRRLASVTLAGTIGGLAISVPLFYFLRERSIVPSIIAYAASCAIAAMIVREKNECACPPTRRETLRIGADFVRLGIYMTLGTFVAMLANYIFIAWLNFHHGNSEVGLYHAGYTIINKYPGLVFTALGMEFYPRLAQVADSRRRLRVFVSQEANMALLVLAPVLTLFIVLRSTVVDLLYSAEFMPIVSMVSWGMVGTLLRALSWCMAFVILARGDGRLFLLTESLSAIASLALNIVCYRLWGITGLGVAYLAWYLVYTVIIAVVYFGKYRLALGRRCYLALAWAMAIVAATVVAMEAGMLPLAIATTAVAIAASATLALRLLKPGGRLG